MLLLMDCINFNQFTVSGHHVHCTQPLPIAGFSALFALTMPQAGTSHTEYKKNFKLVLETADVKNPIFTFPMQGEAAAQRWCARLNTIFNG